MRSARQSVAVSSSRVMDQPLCVSANSVACLAGLGLAVLAACGQPEGVEAQAEHWPAGTILALDGVPISIEEIDMALVPVDLVEMSKSDTHKQRLALTNIVLPRAVARSMAGEQFSRARGAIEELHRQAAAGELPGPPGPHGEYGQFRSGSWREVGLVAWGAALSTTPGEWSLVNEEVGAFLIVRVLHREDGPVPEATKLELDVLSQPYLPPGVGTRDVEAHMDEVRLTIVDPAWRTIVPEHYQYRMGVHR